MPHSANYDSRFEDANRLRKAGDADGAIRLLRDLVADFPAKAAAYLVIGDILWDEGRLEAAAESFRTATKHFPKLEIASVGLFHTLWQQAQMDEAFEEMKRFQTISHSQDYVEIVDEILRRTRANEERFLARSVSLMNNTKWREVFLRASRMELWFAATFICGKEPVIPTEFGGQQLRAPLPEIAFERDQIGDWGGMSGPYKDILWVLFPRRFCYANDCGKKRFRDQRIDAFLEELEDVGKLPLEITENFVRIHGYKPTAG